MKRKRAKDPNPLMTDALRSLAVAIAVVFLMHLVFWIAGHGVTVADELGDPFHILDSD
jgi:hypothetical protein